MVRNNTGFWIHYKAYNGSTNVPELNDSANHTLKLFIDGALSDPNNTPEDIAVGECRIFIDAAESNGSSIITVHGVSSTPDVHIISGTVITDLLKPATAFVGAVMVWDTSANAPKTGETALTLTMTIAQDNTSAGATNAPAEIDASAVPGLYSISVTAPESTGRAVSILGASSTANTNVIPLELAPFDIDYPIEADTRLDTDYAEGTLTGTLQTTIKGPIKLIKLDTGIKVIKL